MADFSYELRHDYCAGRLHPSPRRIMWFMGNRKLTKEEGEDSVVVSSVKKRLRHRNIWKYYSCRLSAACGGSSLAWYIISLCPL